MLFDNRYSTISQDNPKSEAKSIKESTPIPADGKAARSADPAPPEDFLRMREWIRGIQADAEHARAVSEQNRIAQRELHSRLDSLAHRSRRGVLTSVLLFTALAGAGAYAYRHIQDQFVPLGQLPALQQFVDAASQRLSAAEGGLREWSAKWTGVEERAAQAMRVAAANLQASKDFATQQAAHVQQHMQAELASRSQELESSLSGLQAAQDRDRASTAGVQLELADWKRQTEEQFAQARAEQARSETALSARIADNSAALAAVRHNIDRQRVNFELRKEQTIEVAPGVTVTVSKMDVAHQRVEGRIHVIPDGRILWVRNLGIQQPATFYTHADNRPYQIVFTRVARDGAVGYVLVPAQQG